MKKIIVILLIIAIAMMAAAQMAVADNTPGDNGNGNGDQDRIDWICDPDADPYDDDPSTCVLVPPKDGSCK